jgi:hypothetical protein
MNSSERVTKLTLTPELPEIWSALFSATGLAILALAVQAFPEYVGLFRQLLGRGPVIELDVVKHPRSQSIFDIELTIRNPGPSALKLGRLLLRRRWIRWLSPTGVGLQETNLFYHHNVQDHWEGLHEHPNPPLEPGQKITFERVLFSKTGRVPRHVRFIVEAFSLSSHTRMRRYHLIRKLR